MGRAPCCEKVGLRRGRWTAEEDQILSNYIQVHGEGSWRSMPKKAGLLRCGKSCRLRWINYLRSDVKRGNISPEEEDAIIKLHASLGNRWSLIAGKLDGRTDNEIKNYWNSHLRHKITSPSSTTIPTKRRSSVMKTKKPRKRTSTPSLDKQSSLNPIIGSAEVGEVVQDSSNFSRDKDKELEDFFYDESLLMDPSVMLPLTDNEDVINSLISSSSSTDDCSQVNQVDYGWDWDFDGGKSMVGFGGDEEDDIMSWPWESPIDQLGVDAEKQEAMIAWLLS